LVAGVRFDHSSFYGDSTNPRVSTIYKYNEQNVFKLMYAHSFLAPAPNQAFANFGSFTGTQDGNGLWTSRLESAYRVPNPDLKPEKLKTLEFNYEHWFTPYSHIKFAPFYTKISDLIIVTIENNVNDTSSIPGAFLYNTSSFKNVGESKIYGIDISSEFVFQYKNIEFKNWGSFSYIDGENKENGKTKELPMISHYKAKGGSTAIYKEKYLLSPMFRWISGANRNDPNNRTKVSSYFVMDMHGEVKLTPSISIKADITNLFDRQYGQAPFTRGEFAFDEAPQPGRLITGSLYFKF